MRAGGACVCYSEAGFEAVERRPVVSVLVPPLAEEQRVLVEEEMSLHGLEPGQLLHAHRRPLVADPHAEAALQHHAAQLAQVALQRAGRERGMKNTYRPRAALSTAMSRSLVPGIQ